VTAPTSPTAGERPLKILVIDNYDSFTYNLVQYLGELGGNPVVHRNDAIDLAGIEAERPDGIVISPGPGNPKDPKYFGVCSDVLTRLGPRVPTLGVCLGLQGFAFLYGGDVTYAKQLMHGKSSLVDHDGKGVFAGVPSPTEVGRYHSLVADPYKVPAHLEVSARSRDGEIMGLRHREHPIECVQFHPESVLTPHGKQMVRNWIEGVRARRRA